ncbi:MULTISPECIES: ATP-grasp domain-containing protein [unclassified Kitasatospora]|uniref:ATP-grasp domain-containing protein n=1 Tax=unclassified Kitasatospora TaxID=2633591 RepID=UPI0033CB798B
MPVPNPVLHLGWDPRPIGALQRAGAEVTCVVPAKDAPAVRAAGAAAIVVPDPGSVEDVLAGLVRNSLSPSDFGAVCSANEFYLVQAAALAELGGAVGSGSRQMLAMRDKFVQKDLLRRADVRTAAHLLVESLERLDVTTVEYPQVLKPLNAAGAMHTVVVRDAEELRQAIDASRQSSDGPWLLEEYVPGREFFVDGVVREGRLRLFSLSRYFQNLIECHGGGIVAYHTLPESEELELHARTRSLTEAAFKALQFEDGVFHLEVFWDGSEVVFGECAARVGGGRADRVVELTYGVNLHDEWALAALDLPSRIVDEPTPTEESYGGLNLRCPQGTVVSAPTLDETLARPGVVEADIYVTPGGVAPDFSSASHIRAGQAVVSGADTREVAERIAGLSAWFHDSVQVAPTAD